MDPLYIPIVAILMPLVLVPTTLVMKYRHQTPQVGTPRAAQVDGSPVAHADAARPRRAGGVSAIGAGVPAVSVLGAFLTTLLWEPLAIGDSVAVPAIAWGCALLISIGAMVTSLKLASMQHSGAERV